MSYSKDLEKIQTDVKKINEQYEKDKENINNSIKELIEKYNTIINLLNSERNGARQFIRKLHKLLKPFDQGNALGGLITPESFTILNTKSRTSIIDKTLDKPQINQEGLDDDEKVALAAVLGVINPYAGLFYGIGEVAKGLIESGKRKEYIKDLTQKVGEYQLQVDRYISELVLEKDYLNKLIELNKLFFDEIVKYNDYFEKIISDINEAKAFLGAYSIMESIKKNGRNAIYSDIELVKIVDLKDTKYSMYYYKIINACVLYMRIYEVYTTDAYSEKIDMHNDQYLDNYEKKIQNMKDAAKYYYQ